jgi:hypothetical protein
VTLKKCATLQLVYEYLTMASFTDEWIFHSHNVLHPNVDMARWVVIIMAVRIYPVESHIRSGSSEHIRYPLLSYNIIFADLKRRHGLCQSPTVVQYQTAHRRRLYGDRIRSHDSHLSCQLLKPLTVSMSRWCGLLFTIIMKNLHTIKKVAPGTLVRVPG